MTDDERQAQMDFIREQQANAAEMIAALARNQVEHGKRLKNLEESYQLLVQLVGNMDERLDRSDERDARLEEAFQTLVDIAARQDERIRALEGEG